MTENRQETPDPFGFAGGVLNPDRLVCAFVNSQDEEHRNPSPVASRGTVNREEDVALRRLCGTGKPRAPLPGSRFRLAHAAWATTERSANLVGDVSAWWALRPGRDPPSPQRIPGRLPIAADSVSRGHGIGGGAARCPRPLDRHRSEALPLLDPRFVQTPVNNGVRE